MKNKKTEVGPKSYEELIGSMETRETAAAENPQDGRFTEAATLREWKKLLKEKSLVQILEDGIGEQSVGSPSICRLAADENWMASERECDAHLDALRAISKKPELAKEVRDQILWESNRNRLCLAGRQNVRSPGIRSEDRPLFERFSGGAT